MNAAPASQTLVLCQLEGLTFGVPLEQVSQALSRPTHMTALPRREGALEGAFVYRGQVVPVLDLRQWLPIPPVSTETGKAGAATTQLMVLKTGTQLAAVAIHGVRGLTRVPSHQIHRLHQNEEEQEMFHSVAVLGSAPGVSATSHEQQMVSLLDTNALHRLTHVWAQALGKVAATDTGAPDTPTSTNTQPFAVMEMGSHTVALAAAQLATVQPMPPLQKVMGNSRHLLGIARWRGLDVPVIQLAHQLGMTADPTPYKLLAVLTHDGRHLGVPVTQVRSVQTLDIHTRQSSASAGLAQHPALLGLLTDTTGKHLIWLDAAALALACPLSQTQAQTAHNRNQPNENETASHVVFQAGDAWALPIDHLQSVSRPPTHIQTTRNGHPAHLGSVDQQGQAMPLWDLKQLAGQNPTHLTPESRMLTVDWAGHRAGLLVERMLHLLPARQGEMTLVRRQNAPTLRMVTTTLEGQPKTYRIMNLDEFMPPRPATHATPQTEQ